MSRFASLNQAFQQNTQVIQHWWQQRLAREQLVLKVLFAVFVVFCAFTLVWQPIAQSMSSAQSRYITAKQTYDWINANAPAIKAAAKQGNISAADGDWVMNINQSATAAGLALKGFTPQGSNAVSVTLDKQRFDAVMAWLNQLEQKGIFPTSLVISKSTDPGLVDVRVSLSGS